MQRLEYMNQASPQTLREGVDEFYAAYGARFDTRRADDESTAFFTHHDVVHVLFGAGIALDEELAVKIGSIFGTTAGWGVLLGYRSAQAQEIYVRLRALDIALTAVKALYWVPVMIWRCRRMTRRWHWTGYAPWLDVPLDQIRREFGVRVVR